MDKLLGISFLLGIALDLIEKLSSIDIPDEYEVITIILFVILIFRFLWKYYSPNKI